MGLSDIAAGLAVTERQRDRGVATVDRTAPTVAGALAAYVDDLPCEIDAAARLIEAYVGGEPIDAAATAAGLPAVTGAKTLFLLGFEGLSPLSPLGRAVLRDWLDGEIGRSDARALADATEAEFSLATYVETHDPLEGAAQRLATVMEETGNASVAKRDALRDTMSGVGELR